MQSLSIKSINFLKKIKSLDETDQTDPSWRLHYTRLFCELYDIIRTAHDSLSDMDMGKWSVSYDGEEVENTLSFAFSLNLAKEEYLPKIKISINPYGESFIEIPLIESKKLRKQTDDALSNFYQSPAFKRYFAPYTDSTVGLKTIIPVKQITSRHFEAYLLHLLKMMKPYLAALSKARISSMKAA